MLLCALQWALQCVLLCVLQRALQCVAVGVAVCVVVCVAVGVAVCVVVCVAAGVAVCCSVTCVEKSELNFSVDDADRISCDKERVRAEERARERESKRK